MKLSDEIKCHQGVNPFMGPMLFFLLRNIYVIDNSDRCKKCCWENYMKIYFSIV